MEQRLEPAGDQEKILPREKAGEALRSVFAPQVVAPVSTVTKSEDLKQIENILAAGLEEIYSKLPVQQQQAFKREGEGVATKLEILLRAVKIKMHKVVHLIRSWLKTIPGVNKFFLEQESKIKADQLLEYKNKKLESGN